MSMLLVVLFVFGAIFGALRNDSAPQRVVYPRDHDKLDIVDEMVLYGEVTNDEFYGM